MDHRYVLGNALGLFQGKTFLEVKGTFWTNNHLGKFLQGLLEHLSLLGVLEHDEREQKFRWRGSNFPEHRTFKAAFVPASKRR